MIPILILAGGQSRRMRGADKLLEEVDGQPLLRQQAQLALTLGGPVFVALPPGSEARRAALSGLEVTMLEVPEAAEGMSGTLRGAVSQLPACKAFMVLLGDLVALTKADLRAVFDAFQDAPESVIWRGATKDGKPGHPIIFDASLRKSFADLKGDGGGEVLVKPLRDKTLLVPLPGNHARLDLDTPEDWAAWRALRPSSKP